MRFRKRPVIVEAVQWFKRGDHPAVYAGDNITPTAPCRHCALMMSVHGWIDTLEGGHIVCPEDWIITGVHGEHYPCKPVIFRLTYEPEPLQGWLGLGER